VAVETSDVTVRELGAYTNRLSERVVKVEA
jgi:hypothetical protein